MVSSNVKTVLSSALLIGNVAAGAVAAAAASGTVHRVEVGNNQQLRFVPDRVEAAQGDTVEFTFFPRNHSVVQTTFDRPCESTEGFFSGFMPVAANTTGAQTFTVTVNDTNPVWFYCSQRTGAHCVVGMVGCINCPTEGERTLETFAAAAAEVANSSITEPAAVGGGVVAQRNGGGSPSGGNGSPSGTSGNAPATSSPNAGSALIGGQFGSLSFGAALAAAAFLL